MKLSTKIKNVVLAASLAFTSQANASIFIFDDIAENLVTASPGNFGIINSLFEVNVYTGLSNAQVQEIKDTVVGSLSVTQVSALQQTIDSAADSMSVYSKSSSGFNLDSVENQTSNAVNHAAFNPINVTDHYLLTGHLGVAIGLRVSFFEELVNTGEFDQQDLESSLQPLYNKYLQAGNDTDSYINGEVRMTSHQTTNCTIRAICYDYKVRDEIDGATYWYRYQHHGSFGYNAANNKKNQLISSYKDQFKGANYTSSLASLKQQAGL
ncbi:hypothetical protein QWY77_14090 [Thalassotalea ponticola]|uniref:hypothetical protein n=1 Tax=Thalassotalea TaxID=1518149 RepID=UPI0011641B12|nr:MULTISPECIES: hypothetical protein [Thalassotalea]MDN3653870.1 hypothetical protein [Thalassotalea ponticola]QDP00229.1 hypothetical protein FNC98_02000 [Thalassotalea sp. PS06]